jgi:hypothetical protein
MPAATPEKNVVTVRLPSGGEVYDGIMSEIEPDLVRAVIPTLDVKYAGETPEQHAVRLARYRAAYAEYAVRFAAWASEMSALVSQYRKSALKLEEQESRSKDSSELASIEDQFNFATSSNPSL